jgi:tetratricopeptide (TPR) repeat protein
MKTCPACGEPIPEGQEKCPSCGKRPMNLGVEVTAHINLLKKKIEKEPSNTKLHIDLADLYQKHSLLNEALSEYQKAVAVDAKNFLAQFKSAHIFLKFKKFNKAESAFRAALHINPKSTESLIGLFRTYYLQNRIAEAIALGEKIVKSKPDNVEFHVLMKNLYNRKGSKEKALLELQKLESLIPDSKQFIKEIALHYRKENNLEKMIEYYHKMQNVEIEDIDLGFQIGKYYYDNNEYDKAVEHLDSLFKKKNITPEMDVMIRTYLALAWFNKDKIPGAKNLVDEIQPSHAQHMDEEMQKKLASLFFGIGQNDLQSNKLKKAITFFEKAVSYDKDNVKYGQLLEETKNKAAISNKKLLNKISVIAISAIATCVFVVLVWILIHNKIIIHVEPAEDVAVFIDGNPVKNSSKKPGIISSPMLLMGKHNIVIEKTGYEKWQGSVNIGVGRSAKLTVELVPIYFSLRLASVPESATVIIDGRFVGKTPFVSEGILAGRHVLELEHVGHAKWRTNLMVTENDSIDLGIISLKNLAGKWYGKIGKDSYAYNAAFNMTISQTNADLTIKYYHQPIENCKYTGKIHGKIEKGEFYAEGNVTYKYLKVFYWAKTKKRIVMQGKISENWDRIEGKHSVEGLGEHNWWANSQ